MQTCPVEGTCCEVVFEIARFGREFGGAFLLRLSSLATDSLCWDLVVLAAAANLRHLPRTHLQEVGRGLAEELLVLYSRIGNAL